jgi:SpoIID/LytB domain protein
MPMHRAAPRLTLVSSRLLVAALMATLVMVGLAVPPSAAAASTDDRLALAPMSKSILRGTSIDAAVTWRVNGKAASGSVTLQHRVGGQWRTARAVAVTAGRATVVLKPGATKQYRLVAGRQASVAKTISVWSTTSSDPATQLSFVPAATIVSRGSGVEADVTWKRDGNPQTGSVNLQHRVDGSWVTARLAKVTDGTARVILTPGATKSYRLVVGRHPSAVATITVAAKPPAAFDITGGGWGHGVGMSQYGAWEMAKQGSTASEILTHYYSGTKVEARAADRQIRVQVRQGGSTEVTVTGGRSRVLVQGDDATTSSEVQAGPVVVEAASGGRITARVDGTSQTTRAEGAVIVEWENTSYFEPDSTATAVARVTGAPGSYRHGRLVVRNVGGKVNVVNVLRINDEYLYGIAEMPSSWHTKALQAQAIAARTFALANLDYRESCDCNVYDDTRSQMFLGWNKENQATYGEDWVAAVDATIRSGTDGLVVTRDGKLIATYYFSSSAGATLNSENVWSATLPYARSVADPGSTSSANPRATWKLRVSQAKAAAFFGLPNVASLKVTAFYPGKGVKTMVATSMTGVRKTVTAKADRFRLGLGLYSGQFTTIRAVD